MAGPDQQLVLTPDGRQISQQRWLLEQQRAGNTDKLNSLLANPVASGVYGATGNDAATGITAGFEQLLYAAGAGGFLKGNKPVDIPRQAPRSYLQQKPSKMEQKGNPDVRPAINMDQWTDNKVNELIGKLSPDVMKMFRDSRIDLEGLSRDKNAYSEVEELQRNHGLRGKFTNLGDHMQLWEPKKPGPEEQTRIDAAQKYKNTLEPSMTRPVRNSDRIPAPVQPDDPNEYPGDPRSVLESPKLYSDSANWQQLRMRHQPDPGGAERLPVPVHRTEAEDLVTSGNWARPMSPVINFQDMKKKLEKP